MSANIKEILTTLRSLRDEIKQSFVPMPPDMQQQMAMQQMAAQQGGQMPPQQMPPQGGMPAADPSMQGMPQGQMMDPSMQGGGQMMDPSMQGGGQMMQDPNMAAQGVPAQTPEPGPEQQSPDYNPVLEQLMQAMQELMEFSQQLVSQVQELQQQSQMAEQRIQMLETQIQGQQQMTTQMGQQIQPLLQMVQQPAPMDGSIRGQEPAPEAAQPMDQMQMAGMGMQ